MAGKRQHFIPRHFQKPFVIPNGNDNLWMYRRGAGEPFKVPRKEAAAQRYFYSKPSGDGSVTLDDLITDYEYRLTEIVDKIRELPVGARISAKKISEVVSHLTIRASYIREFMTESAGSLAEMLSTLFYNPQRILGNIQIPIHATPLKIEKVISEKLDETGLMLLTNVTDKAVARLVYFAAREEFDVLRNQAEMALSPFMLDFLDQLSGTAKLKHAQLLQEELVPQKRLEFLEALNWILEYYELGDAILPDCVAIAKTSNEWSPFMFVDVDSLEMVIIPIAPDLLAVGQRSGASIISFEDYNENAANSCFSFFLSSRRSAYLNEHLLKLGSGIRTTISDFIIEASQDVVTDAMEIRASKKLKHTKKVTWSDCTKEQNGSYPVSFRDCADQQKAEKIAQTVQEVTTSIAQSLPISALDGITFAYDYEAALRELDRGHGVSKIVDPASGISKSGVGMPLLVQRDSGVKTHVIMREEIANSLIDEDPEVQEGAIIALCHCLSTVSLNDLIATKFPDILLAPFPDTYDGWLSSYVENIFSTYFSTRVISPQKGWVEFYDELSLEQLIAFIEAAHSSNEKYKLDSDHMDYFVKCAHAASNLLNAMARLFASRANIIGPFSPSTNFDLRLSELRLSKWAKLFETDIGNFYHRVEDWDNYEEIHFLNRHLERLLFEMGVLPDQLDDGDLYVHISDEVRVLITIGQE